MRAFNPSYRYLETDELRDLGFSHVGETVTVHSTANIVGCENVSIGSNVRIDAFVSIIASSPVEIGNYVHIGSGCYLSAVRPITLKNFTGLSQNVAIYTATDDYHGFSLTNPTVPKEYTNLRAGAVTLREHVIVGSGSVIMPDLLLDLGSCVGALSFISKSTKAWGVYAGRPASKIADRSRDLLALQSELERSVPS